eukprot:UN10632
MTTIPSLKVRITNLEEKHSFRATTLPDDVAWAPVVPLGHTSFTWYGHFVQPDTTPSYILGCLVDPNAPKVEEKKVVVEEKKVEVKKKQHQHQQQTKPATVEDLYQLNLIVGEIKSVKKHPYAVSDR